MSHLTHEELNKKINEAGKLVVIGGIYKHYKYPERDYMVEKICIQESTEKVCIVYKDLPRRQAGRNFVNAPSFVRYLDSWLESVVWKGGVVQRFQKVILKV